MFRFIVLVSLALTCGCSANKTYVKIAATVPQGRVNVEVSLGDDSQTTKWFKR